MKSIIWSDFFNLEIRERILGLGRES